MTEAAEYRRMFDRVTLSGTIILVTLLIGLSIWGIYYTRQYEGIISADAFNQAQAAREFYFGRGLSTLVIKPLFLLRGPPPEQIPDAYLSPLPVLLLARFLGFIGIGDGTLLGYSLFWALLTGVVLFIFARVIFGNLVVSALAFIVYMTNTPLLESGFSGQSFPLVSLLLLIYLWLYYRRPSNSLSWSALLGASAGFLYLCEFDFLFLAVPLAIFLYFDSTDRRKMHLLTFVIAFFLASLPWLIRNAAVFGNPFFSLRWLDFRAYSLRWPGNRISRDFSSLGLAGSFPLPLFWNKFVMFLRLMHPFWLSFSLSLLPPFFLGGLFLGFRDRAWTRAARLAVVLFFGQLILIAAGNGDFSRMLYFVPFLVIGGIAAFREILGRLSLSRQWSFTLLALFCVLNGLPGLVSLAYGLPSPRYLPAIFSHAGAAQLGGEGPMEQLQKLVRPGEVVVSDIPWAVAWYSNRRSLWIPWEIEQMKGIKKLIPRVRFLHLSPTLFKYPPVENVESWRSIYRTGRVPEWLEVDRGILLPGDHLLMGDIILERLNLE